MEYCKAHPEKAVAMIFLDAEKVFDNVDWNFMILQLETMEVGQRFTEAIKTTYNQQKAKTEKGTKQGCPLSPLLFILVIQ